MIDMAGFIKRIRKLKRAAAIVFFGGAAMLVIDFTTNFPTVSKGEFAALWVLIMGVGMYIYYLSMELPAKEVLYLAEKRNGVLTLGEVVTSLEIDPELALRTLRHLQGSGLATPRWEELQKNLWEFPDYVKLPIAETIDIARSKGGRVSLKDLLANGVSLDVAVQTFNALSDKGIGRQEGEQASPEGRSLVMEK